MVAGMATQLASLFIFSICAIEFGVRVYLYPSLRQERNAHIYDSRRFKVFLYCKLSFLYSPSIASPLLSEHC